MNLNILLKVLEDAGCGTIGQSLFAHRMDADVQVGIMLRNPLDGIPVDENLPGFYRSKLQAIVRAQRQAEGDDLADRAVKALRMFNRSFRDDQGFLIMKVNHIYPDRLPIVYPRSPGQGIEWSLNFKTCFVIH